MNSNQHSDLLSCVYVLGTEWGMKVGRGSHSHLSTLWVLLRVRAGSISHGWESMFCNTSAHFHLSHHSENTFTASRSGPSFSFFFFPPSFFFFFFRGGIHAGGSSLSPSITVIRGPHMLAKLNAKQMALFSGYILPLCKSSIFSEMWNKMNLLYKIL